MKISTPKFRILGKKILSLAAATSLFILIFLVLPQVLKAQQGVAPTLNPEGGFAIDGNLLSRVPDSAPFTSDNGDFLPNDNVPGTGGHVFDLTGEPLDTTTAFHIVDGYDMADQSIFTNGSKLNDDPNTWMWKPGKPPAKDDIDHALLFFASDSMGNVWFIGAGDRNKTNGNTYLDFELLQYPLYMNPDSTFTSMGPDGGRTIGDLLVSITYTIGGSYPQLFIYRWDSTGQGNFEYSLLNPAEGTTFLAMNEDSAVIVPYGAFGSDTYPVASFTEVACNLNDLVPGSNTCLNISTVLVKTKASQSIHAALKDFVTPVQVDISSAPVISVNSPTICLGDTATLTATVISGTGPYTYSWSTGDTTESIMVSPDTTAQYTVVVTGANGCSSAPDTATVTVMPLPECFISGPDTICPSDSMQFYGPDSLLSYAWMISGSGTIVSDTSNQMVTVQGNGDCDSSFTLTLAVSSAGECMSECSKTVELIDHDSPVITGIPDSLTVECASDVPAASPDSVTVTDNCGGAVDITVSDSIADQACPNQFTVFRTWIATDLCGNVDTTMQVITVNDTVPPILEGVPADTLVCCADSIPPPAVVTATDYCDGILDVGLSEVVSDSTGPDQFVLTRTWTAEDTCGNVASDSQVITVNDTLFFGSLLTNIASKEDIILYFNVTPNPFTSVTNIQFALKKDARASVDLFNFTGARIMTVFTGDVSAGARITLQLSPDASVRKGIYLLVLRTSHGIETRQIILN